MTNLRNFSKDTQIQFGTKLFGDEVSYNVQMVVLPGLDTANIETRASGVQGWIQGDSIDFQDLTLSVIVDEDINTWKSVMKQMLTHVNVKTGRFERLEADSWVQVMNSSGEVVLKLKFINSSIINIGTLTYDSTGEDAIMTFDLVMQFDWFEIVD